MSNLKNGSKAIVNTNNPSATPLYAGDVVTVINMNENKIEIETNQGVTWWIYEHELDTFLDLPKGTQLNLGPIEEDKIGCDCGGYKTFKSMAPQYHSYTLPCSSLKEKT